MLTAEALFDGAHFAHIAAWEEEQRRKRIANRCRDHYTNYGVKGKFAW